MLELRNVDAGHGWLIFRLPPSELAVHPSSGDQHHELYLMCDDINLFVREMGERGIACSGVQEQRWGLLVELKLPGGGRIGVYQPKHARP